MFRTTGDLKDETLVRLNAATTAAGFYTDTHLNDWLDQAHRAAAAYRKWPFTEGRVSTTYAADTSDVGFGYPEGWKTDSIRIVQVGGKRFQKVNHEDYLIYREENDSGEDKIFSDYGRLYFINPNADVSGTTVLWGQYIPGAFDRTDPTVTTVFSDAEEEGNEAMIELMLSFAKTREKKLGEAREHRENALKILDGIWERISEEAAGYHTHDRGMFKRFDVLEGGYNDKLFNRDQF